MRVLINETIIDIPDDSITENTKLIKEGITARYSSADAMLRAGLKLVSRKTLDQFHEQTGDNTYIVPTGKDPNLHLIDTIFSQIEKFFDNIQLRIEVVDGKVIGACLEKINSMPTLEAYAEEINN